LTAAFRHDFCLLPFFFKKKKSERTCIALASEAVVLVLEERISWRQKGLADDR
jgi:hypothetical protein